MENGCLAVATGSHRVEPLTRRCRKDDTGKAEFVDLEVPLHADVIGAIDHTGLIPPKRGEYEYTKLEVKVGTLVLMHGNLMHTSEANCSKKSRVAFNFGIVEGRHRWREDNYLQPYEGETEFERLQALW